MTSTEGPRIRPRIVRRDPSALTRLEVNAHFQRKEEFDQLVENIRADGCLTSVPLVYGGGDYAEGAELILSGNHRCDAAVVAGLTEIDVLLISETLTRDELIAKQLSHNAITGDDDPATLVQLYNSIEDVDWRTYAGLDDAQLALLDEVNLEGLSEANLDFATVSLVFLPPELERAREALDLARAGANATWLAAYSDYEPVLDALTSTQNAHNVGNVATALGIILAVFEAHIGDLQDGYLDPQGDHVHTKQVGWETVFGSRTLPAEDAAVIIRALKQARKNGSIPDDRPWQMMTDLARAYVGESP
ncbi:hypothetical protein BJF83_20790 [Nocardiopsis sp. CNR-923]|uniref:ParB N-terminal domain-containing protein n=1 Tax=Nocardiopsis sp. CNR-923 TaxID=1904965 RepID=UPI000959FD7E|nr:ParB N-terminal domain-containing protein [Nocardiopsis sp. CNR-923]OLT26525.1 hypothetical protein BJF83_20790 [Nocardiopsis sp. CNR-923]